MPLSAAALGPAYPGLVLARFFLRDLGSVTKLSMPISPICSMAPTITDASFSSCKNETG